MLFLCTYTATAKHNMQKKKKNAQKYAVHTQSLRHFFNSLAAFHRFMIAFQSEIDDIALVTLSMFVVCSESEEWDISHQPEVWPCTAV